MIDNFEEKHLEKSVDIFFDIYKNEPFNYQWIQYKAVSDYFTDIFKTPKFRGFVFLKDDITVGICVGIISDYFKVKKYRISEIFISRKFQKKGIGSEFLSEIRKILFEDGIEVIEISTDKNTPAFDFYLKNDYSVLKNNVNMIKITGNF